MRSRLALVLAGLMIVPLALAWAAIDVLVPRAVISATSSRVDRAAKLMADEVRRQCLGVRDAAELAGNSLRAQIADSALADAPSPLRGDRGTALANAALRTPIHRSAAAPQVTLLQGERVVAESATSARVDLGAIRSVQCTQGQLAASGPAVLSYTYEIDVSARRVATAIAWLPLNRPTLASWRTRLGVSSGITLLDTTGSSWSQAASRRAVLVADGVTRVDDREVQDQAIAQLGSGQQRGGTRHGQHAVAAAGAVGVLATEPVPASGLRGWLAAAAVFGMLAAGLLGWLLASRLTEPLVRLTAVARRWHSGELGVRSNISGQDEVGQLGGTLDAMAGELQRVVSDLEASRDALSETFERFGEALGRTHDLDGLLRTLAEAAMTGADAVISTVLVGDSSGLEERSCAVDLTAITPRSGTGADASGASGDQGEAAESGASGELGDGTQEAVSRALSRLAMLAITEEYPVRVERLPGVGPAVALPLRRDEKVIGVLTVARAAGAEPLDDTALAAVGALAMHAGTAIGNVIVHEETRRMSVTDALTGVGNIRHLSTTLSKEVERAHRFGRPLSVLMIDLDHFKAVNDNHGHDVGDVVLREFARRLSECLREVDTVARYGGEEFAVVLPETDGEGAVRVAERILEAVRAQTFAEQQLAVTASIGVASYPIHGRGAAEVLRSADSALYAAKRDGRDRYRKARRMARPRAVPAVS